MRVRDSLLATLALLVLGAGAASADTGFSCILSSSQEVPINASTASGSASFVLDVTQTSLSVNVQFINLTGTYSASHLHSPGAVGVNAAVRFPFVCTTTNSGHNGTFNGFWNQVSTPTLASTDVTNLINHLIYVNIHSTFAPGGEIRGQIEPDQSVPARSTSWGRLKTLYAGR